MSLTNPNDVITEARLAEFYGQILPYLGGMPEMVANKFSKGDLYSTDEKMIGQWIDGKPIYKKTISTNISSFVSGGNSYKYYDISSLNVDKPLGFSAIAKILDMWYTLPDMELGETGFNGNYSVSFTFRSGNNGVVLWAQQANMARISDIIFTLTYTKTTDSAIAIGNDTDYSTTEKIVGTWIDGKPLYQKTFSTTMPDAVSTPKFVAIGASVDYVCCTECAIMINNASVAVGMLYTNNAFTAQTKLNVHNNTASNNPNSIELMTTDNGWLNEKAYVTLRYTKAT